jgi:hypothetical protein
MGFWGANIARLPEDGQGFTGITMGYRIASNNCPADSGEEIIRLVTPSIKYKVGVERTK